VSQPEVEQRASDAPVPAGRRTSRRTGASLPERLSRHLVACGAGLVLLQLAFRAWALSGSWFYFDDLAFMSRAMNQPLDSSYLLESYGGHLMPGGFLVVYGLTKAAAFSWVWWAAVLLVMQALAGVGMLRLLLSMFGRTPFVLALLTGYLSFVFTLSAGIWFAAGINQLPLQIALVFGLHAHLAYLRHRRVRSLVACLLWTAFGLLFYEKTLLLFGIYALVTVGWFSHGRTPERLRHVWDHYRTAVVSYTAVAGVYLAIYVHYGLDFSPGTSNAQPWSPIAWNLVGEAMSTALIGGPFRWEPLAVGSFADPSQLTMLVSWAAVLGVAVYAYRTRTISKRAWSLLGFTLLCNVALLASARANIVGPDIAREYRYQTESAALFVIGLGLAFLPLVGAPQVNRHREGVPFTYETPRLIASATVAVALAAAYSTSAYVDLWQDRNPSRAYFAEVRHTLEAESDRPVPLVDVGIPQTLLWAYRYPENSYSHVLRHLSRLTSYPDASTDRLFMFDDTGSLTPVRIPATRRDEAHLGCGYELKGSSTDIPLDGPVIGGGWWIKLDYEATSASSVRVVAGDDVHETELDAGEHSLYVSAEGEFDTLELSDYASDADVCVGSVTLGLPEPGRPST